LIPFHTAPHSRSSSNRTWHALTDFGIILAFGAGFITLLLIFTEFNTAVAGASNVTLFKRGSKAAVIREADAAVGSDAEKAQVAQENAGAVTGAPDQEEIEKATRNGPKMHDVFSWKHLNYTVSTSDGPRQLLDDISGYVVPGKLTALMGESGAGKTTLLNVLAERHGTGVVTGDRSVNGQNLPADFQAQT
jgi:ATP-binding cassette subfamily G (WHITE) protein 2 (SNQ2)